MCGLNRSQSHRWMMPVGMVCLAVGLMVNQFVHPAAQRAKDWVDGVAGLLVGLSIGLNLMAVWLRPARCRQTSKQ